MRKNNIIFILISLTFLPLAFFGGEKIKSAIYGDTPSILSARSVNRVGDLKLTDTSGAPFHFSNFGADYLLVFFGYTNCPDICPNGLSDLVQVYRRVGEDSKRIKVAFVSFDPKRDTAQVLSAFLKNFHPDFIGLTGTVAEIKAVADRFGVQYMPSKETVDKETGDYQLEHSLSYFLVDTTGVVRTIFRYSDGPEAVSNEILKILKARQP